MDHFDKILMQLRVLMGRRYCNKPKPMPHKLFSSLTTSFMAFCVLCHSQALAQDNLSAPSSGTPSADANALPLKEPITIRSTEMLRRYVEGLANKAGVTLPPNKVVTNAELGKTFLELLPKLSALPPEKLTQQDLEDIGMLSEEFEGSLRQVRGNMLLNAYKTHVTQFNEVNQKMDDARARLAAIEKLKINGDFTFAPQSDMGRSVRDSMSANLRGRLNFLARVKEAQPNERLGEGYVFCRLTAAAGRFFPRNRYLLSPLNDITDANASPFNSGPNEVQVPNLVINNNNSNSLRPTVSLEQAYYSQDFRPGGRFKGNTKAGLIYLGAMFDNNNFANNEALQFMNTQFVNSISWRPNFNGPAWSMSMERPLFRDRAFLRATSAIATITNRDFFGSYGYNHELQFGHIFFKKEGNLRAGFWNWSFRRGTQPPFTTPLDLFGTGILSVIPGGGAQDGPRPVGMYCNFDQRIWKDIGLWGRYAMNDQNIGEVFLGGLLSSRSSWSFGAEIPVKILFKRRPDDVIGIAYGQVVGYRRNGLNSPASPAFVSLNGVPATTLDEVNANLTALNPGIDKRNEKTIEVYYRYQINKNISVSPDVQYIWSPGGTGPVPGIFAIGTRLNVVF